MHNFIGFLKGLSLAIFGITVSGGYLFAMYYFPLTLGAILIIGVASIVGYSIGIEFGWIK